MTDAEIITQCNLLLIAGNVTTTDLIGNGVKALLDPPQELAKLPPPEPDEPDEPADHVPAEHLGGVS